MGIAVKEVVIEGVYGVADDQEHIVREIVSGKVFYEARRQRSGDEWAAGHALEDAPTIEAFAAGCVCLLSVPVRYSRHDVV